jgi:hypothetical protein
MASLGYAAVIVGSQRQRKESGRLFTQLLGTHLEPLEAARVNNA